MDLNGLAAVVTGGESGIGRACAIALARCGAPVTLTYFADAEAGAATVTAITDAGGQALAVQCDVSREDQVEALFAAAEQAFGTVRLLVNSAGVFQFRALEGIETAEWDRILDVNLRGTFLVLREAMPEQTLEQTFQLTA